MSSHVVNDVQESLRVVRKLESEPALAVSAEGVNMGRTGPLTLLLIGTEAGHVYIFDVKEAPDMVSDGGLKRLLESESVVKVMHSGKNHGGALYSQYEVKLSGVFDTQVAQMVLDKAGGRRFPSRLKFVDVVNMHCPERAADLGHDTHTKIKFIISKKKGEYWAQRPLTQEMVQFAENGVLLEHARLMESFRTNVERDILSQRDRTTSDELHAENKEEAKSDVLVALNSLRLQDVQDLPPVVQDLKVQQTKAKLDELENDLNTHRLVALFYSFS
ncbi:hypothetical protein BaRGS_00031972 [Batillaria attramentaria]|uniref:3'-5' exonuclease domain-containing protein n=1 Tax=Batillaria attramentaria TaxID=370345 RepID=A0ABD0JP74_9CAEN